MKSQIKTTKRLQKIAEFVNGEDIDLLINLRKKVFQSLKFLPYNEETKKDEKKIRWKRTADEIFKEGYVYEGKACTDIVIAFLGLAKAKGFRTRFVKIYKKGAVHSIAEIKIKNKWYNYDIASYKTEPIEGEFTSESSIDGWKLWKKGKDAWDIGLKEYNDIEKIT